MLYLSLQLRASVSPFWGWQRLHKHCCYIYEATGSGSVGWVCSPLLKSILSPWLFPSSDLKNQSLLKWWASSEPAWECLTDYLESLTEMHQILNPGNMLQSYCSQNTGCSGNPFKKSYLMGSVVGTMRGHIWRAFYKCSGWAGYGILFKLLSKISTKIIKLNS